ncbi:MAG: hypothetical protein L3J96_07785, partial [Thermoplasmata archaeon]|nr:hypothetical protein [Thermoplasmata archaeon]
DPMPRTGDSPAPAPEEGPDQGPNNGGPPNHGDQANGRPSTGTGGGSSSRPPMSEANRDRLKLSQRVVLHLAAQGRLYDDEIATTAFTQAGMAERLSVGQSPLSNVLRRLVIGGVLTQDVRHVRTRPKRLRVYRLTSMGEALATEIRRQNATRAGPLPVSGPSPVAPADRPRFLP